MRTTVNIGVACSLVFTMVTGQVQRHRETKSQPVLRGTINVALADRNGAVLLTDSMLSSEADGQIVPLPEQPAQKLFQIDDKTVGSVAGFISAGGPIPDFWPNVTSIVQSFSHQLREQHPLDIATKLEALAMLMDLNISAIGELRAAANEPMDAAYYRSKITLVGYDLDGQLKIGQAFLQKRGANGDFGSEVANREVITVGNELVYRQAGDADVADKLFDNPSADLSDKPLGMLAAARSAGTDSTLTIGQLKEIAESLAHHSASVHPTIGGESQIAIIENGGARIVQQQRFPAPKTTLSSFMLLVDGGNHAAAPAQWQPGEDPNTALKRLLYGRGTAMLITANAGVMYIQYSFENSKQALDNGYFYHNTFRDCTVTYNGGPFYFDASNVVEGTSFLFLGPDANRSDPRVQSLLSDHKWMHPTIEAVGWHPPFELNQQ